MLDRRAFLTGAGVLALGAGGLVRPTRAADTVTLPFANGARPLMPFPQKRPLIVQTQRPPQLETPFDVFDQSIITPNDAFFVRYNLAGIPLNIDPAQFTVAVKGSVKMPLRLTLADLKALPAREIVAANQCADNGRGFFEPRVAGTQFGNGAMGNARWRGVPLRTVLDKAGVTAGARQVVFGGLDKPMRPDAPDFTKALDIDRARDGTVMLAYAMNGDDLPMLNGYPLRLVVPGYYGTYWIKHVNTITVIDDIDTGYWTKTAYRVPNDDCHCSSPGTAPRTTAPIGKLNVRSFITHPAGGESVMAGPNLVRGIAFDGGSGIRQVQVSPDGGMTWQDAHLGQNFGPYAFRTWQFMLMLGPGDHALQVRAVSNDGETQSTVPHWNQHGYMRNIIETVNVHAA